MAKVERLVEDIKELGMPVIVVSGFSINPKECFVNDIGLHFIDGNTMGCISTDGTAELKIKDRSDNYPGECRRCYDVRRIRDNTLVAEIFWVK